MAQLQSLVLAATAIALLGYEHVNYLLLNVSSDLPHLQFTYLERAIYLVSKHINAVLINCDSIRRLIAIRIALILAVEW